MAELAAILIAVSNCLEQSVPQILLILALELQFAADLLLPVLQFQLLLFATALSRIMDLIANMVIHYEILTVNVSSL